MKIIDWILFACAMLFLVFGFLFAMSAVIFSINMLFIAFEYNIFLSIVLVFCYFGILWIGWILYIKIDIYIYKKYYKDLMESIQVKMDNK